MSANCKKGNKDKVTEEMYWLFPNESDTASREALTLLKPVIAILCC